MPLTTGKFIVTMMHPKVFVKADIDQPIITTPPIRVNHGIQRHMPTDNGLQCGFRAIWHKPFPGVSKHQRRSFCRKRHVLFYHEQVVHQNKIHRLLPHLAGAIQVRSIEQFVVVLWGKMVLTDRIEILINWAVLVAVKSSAKQRISCLNLVSLIGERK